MSTLETRFQPHRDVSASYRPETTISTRLLTRILILLIAMWSLLAGSVLVFFQGATSGALGAGVEDAAGQRLLGAHLLLLVPVYTLLALRPDRYRSLLWLPFGMQLAVSFVVGYSILSGDTRFGDGVLALAVGGIFVALLGFIWVSEQRAIARARMEDEEPIAALLEAPSVSDLSRDHAYRSRG